MGILTRIRRHGLLLGLLSLAWLIIRSGEKPSRINYPCQQAAKANILASATLFIAPLLAMVSSGTGRQSGRWVAIGLIVLAVSAIGYGLLRPQQPNPGVVTPGTTTPGTTTPGTTTPGTTVAELFPLSSYRATSPTSSIYAVSSYNGTNGGLSDLLDLMGENGAPFYKTTSEGRNSGPEGLIASDDVIIMKVNSQWDQRGGTNTDLIKELITLILAHPDGFSGEIVVADNGQAQYGADGKGGSLDWELSNANDKEQSVQKVVDSFSGSRVSTYSWDTITYTRVEEYSDGDNSDGYVVEEGVDPETGLMVSYPKFTTKYGTHISFKKGVWDTDGSIYDSEHLKVINMPVLKTHSGYGVTGAVKSYMGVPSDKLTSALGHRTHYLIDEGAMGTLMAETRFPTITILDCIWVNSVPKSGPYTSYEKATRVNVVAASIDPVALDYWASKNILIKAAPSGADTSSMNPDNQASGSFGDWLRKSAEELARAGLPSELNSEHVNIYVKKAE